MTTPFTYSIKHIPSGVNYYGVRYASGCQPTDLGTIYFSSCKQILQLLKMEGPENFTFKVRKVFKSKRDAVNWEYKFLTRVNAAQSDLWFNKQNGDGKFINTGGYNLSEKTKKKQSKPKSENHRVKLANHLSRVRTSPTWTEDRKQIQRQLMIQNSFAKGHSRVVSLEEKQKKREAMIGNTISKNVPRIHSLKICPHCGLEGKGGNMTRYHFNNCKLKE